MSMRPRGIPAPGPIVKHFSVRSMRVNAGGGGHFEILQWARDLGCPWDASVCSRAAGKVNFEIHL